MHIMFSKSPDSETVMEYNIVTRVCMLSQLHQGNVTYTSETEDGQRRHLVADTSITAGTWHNVTLTVSGH